MWVSSECRLLKRLAVYGVAKNTQWGADKKLSWLLDKKLLWSFALKHEVFLALKNCYPSASQELRVALLAQPDDAPGTEEDGDHKIYETYDLLIWLRESAPDCLLVKKELDKITAAHPEFGPRDHPDLDVESGEFTGIGLQSPATVEELLSQTAEEQIDFLLSFQQAGRMGASRSGLLSMVQGAISRSAEWSKSLINSLETRTIWNSDLWQSVVQGWNSRELSDDEWPEVLRYLRDKEQLLKTVGYQVATLLKNGIEKPKCAIPDSSLLEAFDVSEKLWAALISVPEEKREKSDDWLFVAINNPAGILAEFWLHLISRLRAQLGEQWTTIPAQCELLFESILKDDLNAGSELARVVFASHLHFLLSSDQAWTIANVLPLLDLSENSRRAIQCWHGYLCWGKWPDDLLPRLLPFYEKLYAVIGEESERTQQRFYEHLAGIACFGSINPVHEGWLMRFVQSVGPKQREAWTADFRMMLKQIKEPAKQKAWDSWVREYWQSRIEGKPMPLSAIEAGEMVEWSLHLEPVFPEVVEKICGGPPPEMKRSFLYYELPDTPLPGRFPQPVAQLILFLLQKNSAPIYDFDRIDKVFEQLATSNVDTPILLEICNELATLGYAGAGRLRALIRKSVD
jgi:hypothetical protein